MNFIYGYIYLRSSGFYRKLEMQKSGNSLSLTSLAVLKYCTSCYERRLASLMLPDRLAAVLCIAGVIVGGVQGSLHCKQVN